MAAGDLVQKGTAVCVGFNGYTYSNFIVTDVTLAFGQANVKDIMGEQGAVVTKLLTNPRKGLTISGVIKASGTELATLVALKVCDAVTVNTVAYGVAEPPQIVMGTEEARCTLVLVKEDSFTYS
jgi:hypothetical protein